MPRPARKIAHRRIARPRNRGLRQGKAAGPDNFIGDAHRGAELVKQYQCGGCHYIPGIAGAEGNVGPPLQRSARGPTSPATSKLAGQHGLLDRGSAARVARQRDAEMDIPEKDARDIAAFLYTLK